MYVLQSVGYLENEVQGKDCIMLRIELLHKIMYECIFVLKDLYKFFALDTVANTVTKLHLKDLPVTLLEIKSKVKIYDFLYLNRRVLHRHEI